MFVGQRHHPHFVLIDAGFGEEFGGPVRVDDDFVGKVTLFAPVVPVALSRFRQNRVIPVWKQISQLAYQFMFSGAGIYLAENRFPSELLRFAEQVVGGVAVAEQSWLSIAIQGIRETMQLRNRLLLEAVIPILNFGPEGILPESLLHLKQH